MKSPHIHHNFPIFCENLSLSHATSLNLNRYQRQSKAAATKLVDPSQKKFPHFLSPFPPSSNAHNFLTSSRDSYPNFIGYFTFLCTNNFWVSEKLRFCIWVLKGCKVIAAFLLNSSSETLKRGGLVVEIVGVSGSMADLAKAEKVGAEKEDEGQRLIEGASIVDFDVLCSNVASQNQGKWRLLDNEEGEEEGVGSGGVFRMWEGEVLDCFDDRRIAVESLCCPCCRFGKNMRQAGLGSCFIQGTVYFLLAASAFLNCIAFIVTRRRCFLYLAVAFTISVGTYLGFFRTKIRNKFNIRGHESFLDDCVYHLVCPCCAISQETRTLEINNVQGGTWHGRGDTICIGTVVEGGKAFVELHPPHPVSVHFDETETISTAKGQGDSIKC